MLGFKVIRNLARHHLLSFSATLVMSALLSFSIISLASFKKTISKQMNQQRNSVHFYALVDKKSNSSWIQRKVSVLPGVIKVERIQAKTLMNQVSKKLNQNGVDLSLVDTAFEGIKVSLVAGLGLKAYEMVQSYVQRLGGEKQTSVGKIKGNISKRSELVGMKIINSIETILFRGAFFFLFLLLAYLSVKNREMSEIFQIHQRKGFINPQSQFFLLALFLSPVMLVAIWRSHFEAMMMIGFISILLTALNSKMVRSRVKVKK